jgi:hypothetical protein
MPGESRLKTGRLSYLLRIAFSLFCMLHGSANAKALTADIPINFGVGPALFFPHSRLEEHQSAYYGLKLDLAAVIDQKTIQKYRHQLPERYREQSKQFKSLRISKFWIPDHIIISPKKSKSYMYGASWRPFAVLTSWQSGPLEGKISAAPIFSYLAFGTPRMEEGQEQHTTVTTHFIRPGLDVRAEASYRFSEEFITSVGWSSALYIPQKKGGDPTQIAGTSDSLWLLHQAFIVFNYRFPKKMSFYL